MGDPREDADDLQMTLHADPVGVAAELCPGRHRHAGGRGLRVIAAQPGLNVVRGPGRERVLDQADRIVGDRAAAGVLEIEQARQRGRAGRRHQIAQHVVAMDQHLRLRQRGIDQTRARVEPSGAVGVGQDDAAVPAEVPVDEQVELGLERAAIVWRQPVRRRHLLQPDQQRDRRLDVRPRRGAGLDRLQTGALAQIAQQQEALLEVAGEHFRHRQSVLGEQGADAQERSAVDLVGRRIHQHARGLAGRVHAPVAAVAGVGRGRDDVQFPAVQVEVGETAQRLLTVGGGLHRWKGRAMRNGAV